MLHNKAGLDEDPGLNGNWCFRALTVVTVAPQVLCGWSVSVVRASEELDGMDDVNG